MANDTQATQPVGVSAELLITLREALGLKQGVKPSEILQKALEALAKMKGDVDAEGEAEGEMEANAVDVEGASESTPDPHVLIGEIRALLGITAGDDGDLVATLKAIRDWAKQNKGSEEIAASVRDSLGLAAGANKDAVLLALSLRGGGDGESREELLALRANAQEGAIKDRLEPYVAKGVLNPHDQGQMDAARRLASADPDQFESLMANMAPTIPTGKTTPPNRATTDRHHIVRRARREYEESTGLQKGTTMQAHVNLALRDARQASLSESEMLAFSIPPATD